MVLVLLRDESFIENKNTKYLEVMGKLEMEIWRRRVGDGDGELKICFGGKEKVDAFTINWLSLVHVNCSTMDCCDWSLFIISHMGQVLKIFARLWCLADRGSGGSNSCKMYRRFNLKNSRDWKSINQTTSGAAILRLEISLEGFLAPSKKSDRQPSIRKA